jgi:hypothetical protein
LQRLPLPYYKTSPLGLQPKFTHKFYIIINGVGNIVVANIFQLNFNDDGIQARISNVPFSSHKSFPTEAEAWQYFTSYYPHVKSPSDAQFMNENCPIKASNLNNPSQHVQEVSGLNFNISYNTHEFFHFNDLPATIQAKHHAASAPMHQLGFTPIDDFTFLHLPPTGTTASTNIVAPLHPPSVVNLGCNDSATANLMSILTHTAVNDEISFHASHLNLNTQPNSTNKHARSTLSQSSTADPTTQYVFLSAPINEPFSITHNNLQNALANANLPTSLLSLPLLAWVPPSALHANKNLVFIQLHDTSYSTQVLCTIQTSTLLSMPQLSCSIPQTPTIDNVNQSPYSGPTFQCCCRITTCPYYYGGNDFFLNDKTGLLHAEFMATTPINSFSYHSHPTSSCPLVGAGAVTSAQPYS